MYANEERSRKAKSKPVNKSLFKSSIIKAFASKMSLEEQLQHVYSYLESLVIPVVLKKPLKARYRSVLGFFVAKLLDFVGANDFTEIERTSVEELQKHLLKGESAETFFEESPNNIPIWRNILLSHDVLNHFYHDLSDSDLDSSSSKGSLPVLSAKRPKMSDDQDLSTPGSSSDLNPATTEH